METLFLKLLNMSIAAGWLIMAVIILRHFMIKAPKGLTCMLWALVAVRLLCPFSLESAFSLIPRTEALDPTSAAYTQPPAAMNSISSYIDNTPALAPGINPLQALLHTACILWIAGLLLMLVYALISYLRISFRMQEAVPLHDNVWLCDAVHSPFILGMIKPRIYLSSSLEGEQISYVLAHEQAHLKRHDHWWKLLGYLLLTVYWFHPLVWAAYILFCRDLELACDERVVKDMDIDGRKAYSTALVACSMTRRIMIVSPLAFGEVGVKERVKTILTYKKPAFWIIIAAFIVCIITALCFLTDPKADAFDIKIVIPAGSEQYFHYSDTEISPKRNQIILSSGEGLGDTSVVLKPIYHTREDAYEPSYMTPGLSVKMYAEKDAWFQIGVAVSNPTDEDLIVYVHVEGVTVRITDSDTSDQIQYNGQWYDKKDLSDETITWLELYNSLPEDLQLAVDHEPYDLHDPDTAVTVDAGYDKIPMVMVNGTYYYDTGMEITRSGRRAKTDGVITSEVQGWEIPQANDQSNFGAGYSYQVIDDHTLEIYINEKWIVFASRDSNTAEMTESENARNDLDTAITAAILVQNTSASPDGSNFVCCDFVPLETISGTPTPENPNHTITCYGWAMYHSYDITDDGIKEISGNHIPIALTFVGDPGGYQLREYWQPRDGSYYNSDIREKFPAHIMDDAIDSQKYVIQQTQNCYRQAVEASGLGTDAIIEKLLATLCSAPSASSNPYDYLDAEPIVYRELIYYGDYTLHYCLNRFHNGNETGLDGKIMSILCETLLQTKGRLPLDADTAATGQLWYDTLLAHGSNLAEPYLNEDW